MRIAVTIQNTVDEELRTLEFGTLAEVSSEICEMIMDGWTLKKVELVVDVTSLLA